MLQSGKLTALTGFLLFLSYLGITNREGFKLLPARLGYNSETIVPL